MTDLPALTFEGLALTPVDRPGGLWLTAAQVGMALGYGRAPLPHHFDAAVEDQRGVQNEPTLGENCGFKLNPQFYDEREASRRVRQIFNRHADQFDDQMTAEVMLPNKRGLKKTRIFSADGCIRLALLARTEQGRRFQLWLVRALRRMEEERKEREQRLERYHQHLGFTAGMLGERLQKYPPERQRLVRRVLLFRGAGNTQRAIADKTGVSVHVVRGILRRFGPFCQLPEADSVLDALAREERRRAEREGRPCLTPEPERALGASWLRLYA